MSTETQRIDDSSTDAETDDVLDRELGRRQALGLGAAAAVTVATAGMGSAAATEGQEVMIDFGADLAHDPWIDGSITTVEHQEGMTDLGYTDDDGAETNLAEHGYVLAENDADDVATNPVTIMASSIRADEFVDFPRGEQYDADGDGDANTDVSALDAVHWTTDASATTGTITVENADRDALHIAVTGQAAGDVATARFDDFELTSGIARKFLQVVQDVDVLDGVVEFRAESSAGTTLVASNDPAGDSATEPVLTSTTGPSQVGQARFGELGDLDDIVALEIAVLDADADLTLHGLNLERESAWTFGTREFYDVDEETLDTEDVEDPSGEFSITSLSTLPSEFGSSRIHNVGYDFEIRASELPTAQVWARSKDTPDTYSYEKELEIFVQFEGVSAYDLTDQQFTALSDVVKFPPARYRELSAATGFAEPDDWDDVEAITWTDRSDVPSSDDEEIEMLSPLDASDLTGFRARIEMTEERLAALTTSGGGAAVGVSSSDGGGFNYYLTVVTGALMGVGVLFRKNIAALLSRS